MLGGKALLIDELSVLGVIFASVAVFLGWAVGRELDPDTPNVANLAMALALVAAVFFTPSVLIAGIALIGIRLVAGTVGAPITILDLFLLVFVGAASGAVSVLWIVGITIVIWLWAAPEVGDRRTWGLVSFLVGVAVGLGFAYYMWSKGTLREVDITAGAYVLAGLAGGAMLVAARPIAVISQTDVGTGAVDSVRVRFARLAAGSFCMWAAVIGGVEGFWAMGPVLAGLVAAAIYRVFVHPAATPG